MTDLFDNNDDKSQIAAYIPGEQGRYKSVEDLAKGKYESDVHIKRVEQENAELRASNLMLREDNQKKAKLEEYVDQLTKATSASNQPASHVSNPKTDVQPYNPQDVESMFDKKIREYEVSKTKRQNADLVVDALKERYGHNYVEVLNKQAQELGLTKDTVNYLAETAPKAFFRTLGLDQPVKTEGFDAPPKKSPMFSPSVNQERTWSWYEKQKETNPNFLRDPKNQEQMFKDYQRLGKAFEDGNFLRYGQESAF